MGLDREFYDEFCLCLDEDSFEQKDSFGCSRYDYVFEDGFLYSDDECSEDSVADWWNFQLVDFLEDDDIKRLGL